jgi:hypothetical protein
LLKAVDGVDPGDVIMPPQQASARGLKGTMAFLRGTIAPEGAVVKATAIDRAPIDIRRAAIAARSRGRPAPPRRHAALGGAPAGQRRHVGGLGL